MHTNGVESHDGPWLDAAVHPSGSRTYADGSRAYLPAPLPPYLFPSNCSSGFSLPSLLPRECIRRGERGWGDERGQKRELTWKEIRVGERRRLPGGGAIRCRFGLSWVGRKGWDAVFASCVSRFGVGRGF